MKKEEIYPHIDHTLLKPYATWEEFKTLCTEACLYKTASVCVPPYFIKRIHEEFKDLNICTVIGFPLGYEETSVKVFEAKEAIEAGASEIDMVVNINAVKDHDHQYVLNEIKELRKATEGYILKVIIETCYLTEEEKIKMCEIVTEAKADYIKTSTGFGTGGATADDIRLFKAHVGENVKIKAAGGISSVEDMEQFLSLGADRLGTSSGIKLLEA